MFNTVHFSSKTIYWETPQCFFDQINKEFNFTKDVCANEENFKCKDYFSEKDNALSKEWTGVCWMNSPYGREISRWVKKAYESEKAVVVCLLPARTDTRWFHDYILDKSVIRFIKGRLKFGKATANAPFPSMLVIFRGNQV